MADDPFELGRFLLAQEPVYSRVLEELRRGRKTSHWMWFIFPQLKGLGFSETARFYGIGSLEEAMTYFEHPLLGSRLLECTALALSALTSSARELFGSPDDLKFRSSMTLFERAAPGHSFGQALERFYGGERDRRTIDLLGGALSHAQVDASIVNARRPPLSRSRERTVNPGV